MPTTRRLGLAWALLFWGLVDKFAPAVLWVRQFAAFGRLVVSVLCGLVIVNYQKLVTPGRFVSVRYAAEIKPKRRKPSTGRGLSKQNQKHELERALIILWMVLEIKKLNRNAQQENLFSTTPKMPGFRGKNAGF